MILFFQFEENELEEFERNYEIFRQRLKIFFILKTCLSSVIETVILLDRLLYLHENVRHLRLLLLTPIFVCVCVPNAVKKGVLRLAEGRPQHPLAIIYSLMAKIEGMCITLFPMRGEPASSLVDIWETPVMGGAGPLLSAPHPHFPFLPHRNLISLQHGTTTYSHNFSLGRVVPIL